MSVTLHTDLGDIKLELYCESVPKACENFLALCASGYYNKCLFHRNIAGFIVQTGDPTGTGKGGVSIWGNKFEDELREDLKHDSRGVLSMANSGPNTNGSQFFISYARLPHLDLKNVVLGRVIDGFEVLDELEKTPVSQDKKYRPLTPCRIEYVTIHANPIADGSSQMPLRFFVPQTFSYATNSNNPPGPPNNPPGPPNNPPDSPENPPKLPVDAINEYYSQYLTEYYETDTKKDKIRPPIQYPISVTDRGVHGVFDIQELIPFLRSSRAVDIVTLRMPKEACYSDYLVICSPFSTRHQKAMVESVKKVYKMKRGSKDPPSPKVEGLPSSNWCVLDMGNIILHIMNEDTRQKYNIEALWTLGPELDAVLSSADGMQEVLDPLQDWIKKAREGWGSN